MISARIAFIPTDVDRHLRRMLAAAILLPVLLTIVPPVVREHPLFPSTFSENAPRVQTAPRTSPAIAAAPQLPPGVEPELNATLAANSDADYTVTRLATPETGLRAGNPAHRFTTTFGAGGVQIAPVQGPTVGLRATTITTEGGSISLAGVVPVGVAARVEYQRNGLTEWYINGPRGLEQGFTLDAPPSGAAVFTLGVAVEGETPVLAGDGTLLIGGLRYGDLAVIDAAGVTLPSRLDVADGAIRIAVDATGATWPVTVDPTITQARLGPQTPAGSTTLGFGTTVAIASANGTTTVVFGVPSESVGTQDDQGAVYVFTGSGATYTQQARLIASDGSRQSDFGQSVAVTINGGTTTVVVGAPNANTAYVYTSSGGAYTQRAQLTAPDPTNNYSLGRSVAAATNGGTTIIAVGADGHTVGALSGVGSVYVFVGSGASYPLQVELNDPNGEGGEIFGSSLALVSNGGVNTLVVGAPYKTRAPNIFNVGAALVFTGSGTSYTSVQLSPSDGQNGIYFGGAVAVGVSGGVTTVAVGAQDTRANFNRGGAAYVYTGSGSSYAEMKLTDAGGQADARFGRSVAVGYGSPIGPTLIAIGAPFKSANTLNPADGVLLFACAKGNCTQSLLPQSGVGQVEDLYGNSVAMVVAANGDMTVVGGTPDSLRSATGSATVSFANEAPSLSSITPVFGNGAQTVASPAGTFTGTPFHLAAGAVNSIGLPLSATGITFTVQPNGATSGRFTAGDPNSTTLHVATHDGTGGTTAGRTDTMSLYPSSTAGTFTVTALADGTTFSTTYTLTIIPSAPKPTINAVVPAATSGPATNTATRNAVGGQAAGLSPAMVTIDATRNYEITVTGTGFLPQQLGTLAFLQLPGQTAIQLDTVYVSANQLFIYISGPDGMFTGLTNDTTGQIYVVTPESSPGAGDGGFSNPVPLQLITSRPAPAGSSLSCSGSTTILVPPSTLFVPPPCQVVDAQGHPVPTIVTGTATGFVGISGGELIAQGGGNLIAQGGGNLIAQGGGNLIAQGGGNVISNDGGSLITQDGGSIVAQESGGPVGTRAPNVPKRNVASHPASGDYVASTDAHGIIMAPPVQSNGIPGTYTHTLAVDGISQPVTYTITNLNPNDGRPTTITSLSRTSAYTSDPAFTLTVIGTGFIGGSVIAFGGVQLATTVTSATQVSATVPANLLKYPGSLGVVVINPDPYGGASLAATFTVKALLTPLPPVQPPGGSVPGASPLPPARPSGSPVAPAPNPLPTGR